LNRQLAGIGDVRAGRPHHNSGMDVFVVRASRPHVLILFRPTEGELNIEYCRWLSFILAGYHRASRRNDVLIVASAVHGTSGERAPPT